MSMRLFSLKVIECEKERQLSLDLGIPNRDYIFPTRKYAEVRSELARAPLSSSLLSLRIFPACSMRQPVNRNLTAVCTTDAEGS